MPAPIFYRMGYKMEFNQSELAPAKINLTLRIMGRRRDGYHALDSVVIFADIGDFVRLSVRGAGHYTELGVAECHLSIKGNFAKDLQGENPDHNLIIKAFRLFQESKAGLLPSPMPGRKVEFFWTLDKNLPVAAGLGGGSSDAAAALRLMEKWWVQMGGGANQVR